MKQWKITVKGSVSFSLTCNYKAVKIEDAVCEAIEVALKLTNESITQVQATLLD